ncbi:extracellular catalytic domain type 1 short-chain-length polyhydroxyalkanoate depolymerase [Priestia aryabhattai]|uniref:extracellular catalytic domain type 1 short-chain-length polyhydroxyalkanoate depolymerase n=1 Tax=Priestia aryabhattai TaxID=412384 RepID=UPI003D292520
MNTLCSFFTNPILTASTLLIELQSVFFQPIWKEYNYDDYFTYKVYVPSTYTGLSKVPLIVMLHGCQQDADDFAAGTEMNKLAEEKGFIVLYPQMNYFANSNGCWNWFYEYNQFRGNGEPDIIKDMIDHITTKYAIDSTNIYLAGMSAGGFMTNVMAIAYPDIFKAVGIHSAGSNAYAVDLITAGEVMLYGSLNPEFDGDEAYKKMGSYARPVPIITFHGQSDTTVNPINASTLIQQWIYTYKYFGIDLHENAASYTSRENENHYSYITYDYVDAENKIWMKKIMVEDMGHAWSGGNDNGSDTDSKGPNASKMMWDFFEAHND